MPKIREAIRSGWKVERSVNFSPCPVKIIGRPVTARIESAAPPRVSPSSLVKTIPVRSKSLLNPSATCVAA